MRKAALGLGVGAALIVVLFVGRLVSENLSGAHWPIREMVLDFRDMPETLGDEWKVTESQDLPQDVFEKLGAEDAEVRSYQNGSGTDISYHGSVFNTFAISAVHTPRQCYPAQGWKIVNDNVVKIPLSDGTVFKPTLLTVDNKGKKALVLFWFQFGDFVVVNRDQKRMAMDHYRKDQEWPCMFKGMLHMNIGSQQQSEEPIKELARYVYEYTRTLQTGKAPQPPANPATEQ